MPLIRAVPLKDFRATALSTTANGTALSTEAPTAGQRLYAALHLLSASTARTFVGTIQSASSSGFGTKTTEITFSLTTVAGATWAELASPSTDRPWRRATWTISTAGGSTGGTWTGLFWVGLR